MFIGHYAVAFAVKRAEPRVNLAVAVMAALWLDVVWPLFVAAGIEFVAIDPGNTRVVPLYFVSYPYSHSLFMALLWGGLFAVVYRAVGGSGRAAGWLAAVVASHWLLDALAHRPDLPLLPGFATKVGLGLWNSLGATVVVEGALFALGVALYLRATRARDRRGSAGLAVLLLLLLASYAASLFGPPPPSVGAIVVVDLFGTALVVALAWWVERHRAAR